MIRRQFLRFAHLAIARRTSGSSSQQQLWTRAMGLQTPKTNSKAPMVFLPCDRLIEEENVPGYCAERFLQVHPGDVLGGKYEVLAKLGFGQSSTVWLAKERTLKFWQKPTYAAVKVTTVEENSQRRGSEVEVSRRFSQHAQDPGYGVLRPAIDHFEVLGKNGRKHLCLVHEPLQEPMTIFRQRLLGKRVPWPLVRGYLVLLLRALDLLHTKCHVIHSDLKPANLLMCFEKSSILAEYVRSQADDTMPRKVVGDRTIYESRGYIGNVESFVPLKLVDYDQAVFADGEALLRHPIQPPAYRAPEILLGIPYSYSTDIWNLGLLIVYLLEGKDIFNKVLNEDGSYSARRHIASMVHLLGPPPMSLLEQEMIWRDVPLEIRSMTFDGDSITSLTTICQFFDGPFFNEDGALLYPRSEEQITNSTLSDHITALDGEEKGAFLDLLSQMLHWVPEKRKTARELLDHPWLAGYREL